MKRSIVTYQVPGQGGSDQNIAYGCTNEPNNNDGLEFVELRPFRDKVDSNRGSQPTDYSVSEISYTPSSMTTYRLRPLR